MRNIKLVIEYDGTNYSGWQKQKNVQTIQGQIESVLKRILKERVPISGSGRTDAGVHALAQVANFKTKSTMTNKEIQMALNALLPADIVIVDVDEVENTFDARKSSKQKQYRYVINNSKIASALNINRECHYKYYLDIENMKLAAGDLVGKHDFKAFMAASSLIKDTVREIYSVKINTLNGRVIIDVVGSGFLYNMVRIIVGTLLDIGSGKLDICTISNMITTGDRTLGGKTVGPEGLYLVEVKY